MSRSVQAVGAGLPARLTLGLLVLAGTMVASYSIAKAFQDGNVMNASPATVATDSAPTNPFTTGEYLKVYILAAHDCGWSTEERAMEAIGQIRQLVRESHSSRYAEIAVIGIIIGEDLKAGLEYVNHLGRGEPVFDQISLGGSWLNEEIIDMVWRNDIVTAALPQVVVMEGYVDAESFPAYIDVEPESVILKLYGRDEIVAWIESGASLQSRLSTTLLQ